MNKTVIVELLNRVRTYENERSMKSRYADMVDYNFMLNTLLTIGQQLEIDTAQAASVAQPFATLGNVAVDKREHAAVLAGLNLLHNRLSGKKSLRGDFIKGVMTNADEFEPLTAEEVDALNERINGEDVQAAEPKTVVNFGPGKGGLYTVRWEIDVKATSVRDAAIMARNQMIVCGDNDVFDVWPKGETAYCTRIDLSNTGRMPDVPACVIVGDIATGFRAYGPYPNAGAAQDDADNYWDSAPAFTLNICDPSDTDWPVDPDEPQPFVVLCGQVGEELDAHGPWKCDVAESFAKHMRDSLGYVTIILPLDPIPHHEEHMFGID